MQFETYEICSDPLGNGTKSQVYQIKEKNHPHSLLIAKIFEYRRIKYYEREKKILLKISNVNNMQNTDYLIHIKNTNPNLEISSEFRADSSLLTFDFLEHGNVLDYISLKSYGKPICELHVKLLCYKLLLGLKKIHDHNISHNQMKIKNIMFDQNFDPVIIHFGDAKISDNHQNDFYGLGMILVGLLSAKQIISYKFNKNINKYVFKFYNTKNHFHESACEESIFWNLLETNRGIKISKEFLNFFQFLVSPYKILHIDDLLNNNWLKEAKDNKHDIEKIFKEEFNNKFNFLKQSKKLSNIYKNNLNTIIDFDEMKEELNQKSFLDKFL